MWLPVHLTTTAPQMLRSGSARFLRRGLNAYVCVIIRVNKNKIHFLTSVERCAEKRANQGQ